MDSPYDGQQHALLAVVYGTPWSAVERTCKGITLTLCSNHNIHPTFEVALIKSNLLEAGIPRNLCITFSFTMCSLEEYFQEAAVGSTCIRCKSWGSALKVALAISVLLHSLLADEPNELQSTTDQVSGCLLGKLGWVRQTYLMQLHQQCGPAYCHGMAKSSSSISLLCHALVETSCLLISSISYEPSGVGQHVVMEWPRPHFPFLFDAMPWPRSHVLFITKAALDIYEWLVAGRDVHSPIPADIETYNILIRACHQVRQAEGPR
eukprot:scaffold71367_cov21-Tisochrysis_lutea.AAC.2